MPRESAQRPPLLGRRRAVPEPPPGPRRAPPPPSDPRLAPLGATRRQDRQDRDCRTPTGARLEGVFERGTAGGAACLVGAAAATSGARRSSAPRYRAWRHRCRSPSGLRPRLLRRHHPKPARPRATATLCPADRSRRRGLRPPGESDDVLHTLDPLALAEPRDVNQASRPGRMLMNAPNLVMLTTLPLYTAPTSGVGGSRISSMRRRASSTTERCLAPMVTCPPCRRRRRSRPRRSPAGWR